MGSRKVIPFPKQKKSPGIYKGGILQFSTILDEALKRQPSESDDQNDLLAEEGFSRNDVDG